MSERICSFKAKAQVLVPTSKLASRRVTLLNLSLTVTGFRQSNDG